MEEGAAPGPGSRETADAAQTADDGTRAQLANGDKTPSHNNHHHDDDDDHLQQQKKPAAANMKSSGDRPQSPLNLFLAACTGQ